MRRLLIALLLFVSSVAPVAAQAPVSYRISFPAPEHRWMQVEAIFTELPAAPLQVRMSRTSPGRYALHEFAKNVFDVRARDGKGEPLAIARPDLHQWDVSGHDGTVVITYRVFGDRVDGTYLSVDATHAHINMPAALMWGRGLQSRPVRVLFEQPAGRRWRVASQLYSTSDPLTFTAPNFHYLMDSPTEFSDHTLKTFNVPNPAAGGENALGRKPTFRIALHHDGTPADADAFAKDVERIVREAVTIFGEFPRFENDTYTFLSDYLPWASGDGMEHRNSTVLSSPGALRNPGQRIGILGTVAHEFFHAWNMERIRARDLEPFDFEKADVSSELWLGEGFTSYYDDLILRRAGLSRLEQTLERFSEVIDAVSLSPARKLRTAEEMSRLAPFVDAAAAIDRTNWDNTFISYYTFGAAIGLALDLSLRDRTDGRTTLDTYMQALWVRHGRPGQKEPGLVATPYTTDDLKAVLAEVSGDPAFAQSFFGQFIQGHELADYGALLARAGMVLRKRNSGAAYFDGSEHLTFEGSGARVASPVAFGSWLYKAGVERDDLILSIDGVNVTSRAQLVEVLRKHKPGDQVAIRFIQRGGETLNGTLVLDEDPRQEIVPIEAAGGVMTEEQQRFRSAWLDSKQR